ncbi:MAG TPA: VacB/RNase II family 3'-5' exoribonuclease, partial [Burkholderiaceae bacterium]|nr:VacB/RNase II family 3'-5' exoribonuclease [Burkholderiaceae bacterium]
MAKRSRNDDGELPQRATPELPPDFDPVVPSREAILELLRNSGNAFALDDLAQALSATVPASKGFKRRLQAMERDGQIVVNARGMYLASSSADFIAGKVLGHRDGFGFLSRDDGGPDLFLAPREMLKVVHGDRVLVKPDGDYRGKPEGLIVEVLEHRTNRLVGRFLRERGVNIVVPEDQRIKHDVLIAAGDTMGAGHGQVVVAEIIQQPTRHTQPVGRIVEVLGEIDDPGMEIEIAVRKFDVPVDFSERAERQAARIPDVVRPADIKGRVDLRSVPFITIDGEDARDFDDAVYCEAIDIGTERRRRPAWRLLVAISDVSHYVRPGDSIDLDALERGTSVYFPRRVIPMLPEVLSNGICSLNPNEDRLVLVCDMVIPGNGVKAGQVSAYQFYTAVIRSHARTTYDQVWTALQQPDGPGAKEILEVLPQIQELYQLFHVQEQARIKRGAIEFDTVETRILATPLGRIEQIVPVERNDAHRIIEECMLAANTCAADFMRRNRRQGLYRVHEGPTPEKLSALRDYLRTLGLRLGGGDDP